MEKIKSRLKAISFHISYDIGNSCGLLSKINLLSTNIFSFDFKRNEKLRTYYITLYFQIFIHHFSLLVSISLIFETEKNFIIFAEQWRQLEVSVTIIDLWIEKNNNLCLAKIWFKHYTAAIKETMIAIPAVALVLNSKWDTLYITASTWVV